MLEIVFELEAPVVVEELVPEAELPVRAVVVLVEPVCNLGVPGIPVATLVPPREETGTSPHTPELVMATPLAVTQVVLLQYCIVMFEERACTPMQMLAVPSLIPVTLTSKRLVKINEGSGSP